MYMLITGSDLLTRSLSFRLKEVQESTWSAPEARARHGNLSMRAQVTTKHEIQLLWSTNTKMLLSSQVAHF